MAAVEKSLSSLDGVISARVNLSMKRAAVRWRTAGDAVPDLIGALERIGYRAHLFAPGAEAKDVELPRLVRAMAVAGFCSMGTVSVLARDGQGLATFLFEDQIRPDAAQTVRDLMRAGIASEILSGDRIAVANAIAKRLGIDRVSAELLPFDKVARVAELARLGRKVMRSILQANSNRHSI